LPINQGEIDLFLYYMALFTKLFLLFVLLRDFDLPTSSLLTLLFHLHFILLMAYPAIFNAKGLVHCNHLLIFAVTLAVGWPET